VPDVAGVTYEQFRHGFCSIQASVCPVRGRRIDAGESTCASAIASHSIGSLASPVKKAGKGDGHSLIRIGHQFPEHDQTIGIGEREWLEQDSIDDAENRRVRSTPRAMTRIAMTLKSGFLMRVRARIEGP
jgi:hypothetical protein